jgi:hypothetical protein
VLLVLLALEEELALDESLADALSIGGGPGGGPNGACGEIWDVEDALLLDAELVDVELLDVEPPSIEDSNSVRKVVKSFSSADRSELMLEDELAEDAELVEEADVEEAELLESRSAANVVRSFSN